MTIKLFERWMSKRSKKKENRSYLDRRSNWKDAALKLPSHFRPEMAIGTGESCKYSFLGVGLAVCIQNDPDRGSWVSYSENDELIWFVEDATATLSDYYRIHPGWIDLLHEQDMEGESSYNLGWMMMAMPILSQPENNRSSPIAASHY